MVALNRKGESYKVYSCCGKARKRERNKTRGHRKKQSSLKLMQLLQIRGGEERIWRKLWEHCGHKGLVASTVG